MTEPIEASSVRVEKPRRGERALHAPGDEKPFATLLRAGETTWMHQESGNRYATLSRAIGACVRAENAKRQGSYDPAHDLTSEQDNATLVRFIEASLKGQGFAINATGLNAGLLSDLARAMARDGGLEEAFGELVRRARNGKF